MADYYVLSATAGDLIKLTIVNRNTANGIQNNIQPFITLLRDTADQIVAVSPVTQSQTFSSGLEYTVPTNGNYVIEVFSLGGNYDLFLSCPNETGSPAPDMHIVFNGTNIPNGGTIIFPTTHQGMATNASLCITNAGGVSFRIRDIGTNGDFRLSNYVSVTNTTISAGTSTNLLISFNAATNGLSLGAVTISSDYYPVGSNYIVYLQANTFPTGATPAIKWTMPSDGSTYFYGQNIPFAALVTPGSAGIGSDPINLEEIDTNGMSSTGYHLSLQPPFYYTNQDCSFGNGDHVFSTTITDANHQSASAAPVLLHVIPFYPISPTVSPQIAVLFNGLSVNSGDSIVFPQTIPGLATNILLVITNSGDYPLGIMDVETNGDFAMTNSILGSVLMPGASTNLGMVFNATASGQSVGGLWLGNNASVGGYYFVSLIGSAYPPGQGSPPTNREPPVARDDPFHVLANSVNNVFYPLVNDFDTNNFPLTIVSTTSPQGGTASIINGGTAIRYTPPHGIRSYTNDGVTYPADGFKYNISDGHGGTASGVISVFIDASDIPEISLTASNSSVTAGIVDPIAASITPPQNIVQVTFYRGETVIGIVTNGVNGVFTLNWIATYDDFSDGNITASATDKFGQVGVAQPIQVNVLLPVGGGQITAKLDHLTDSTGTNTMLNPANLNTIRDGIFSLYGQAFHSLGSNVVWELGVYTIDGTLVKNLSPISTGAVGSSSATNLLATCDLTTLVNGVYALRLSVSGGYILAETNVQFRLESNLKIGQFSFSQQDLIIPVNGIPLTVTRTYNSINPHRGDFGYGWTYALNDMDISIDETRQGVPDLDGEVFSQRSGGSWDVTLTLPNGQRTTFYFYLDPDANGTYHAKWQPAPGVTAKLGLLPGADDRLETILGAVVNNPDLFYWDARPGVPMDAYDFPGFVLTTQDGTEFTIKRQDLGEHWMPDGNVNLDHEIAYGAAYLSQIKARTGDIIAINPNSIVSTATNGATREIVFQRNDHNLIVSVSDPSGLSGGIPSGPSAVKYEYDSSDNLVSVLNLVDRSGVGTYVTNSFSYTNVNFPHFITGIINADGSQVAKNFYDDSGKLIAVQDADGNLTQFIHNLTNDFEVIIDQLGHTNTFVYDLRGNVITQTNQIGQITRMAYDLYNNKTNEVVFLNGQPYATNSYLFNTNLNLMLVSTDPLGHTNSFSYDDHGNLLASTDAKGNSTTNIFDNGSGNLISTVDMLGHSNYNYFSGSLMLGSRDAIGTVSTNYYDPGTGYLLRTATTDASGTILSSNTFVYDENGNRTISTVWRRVSGSWVGASTTNLYDAMNRVVQTLDPDGGTNTVIYSKIGKQQATIDALGRTTSFIYDSQGRLTKTIYPDSMTERSIYDASGNRRQSVDRAGRITTYVYDALNRLVQTIYPDSTTNTTVYDGVGRVMQSIDARGTISAFSYDVAGRRLAVTNAFGTSVAVTNFYGYDANGNQTTFTDGLNHTTTNVFDVLNRQIKTWYPDGTTNSTGYDVVGRRVVATNQDGIATWFGYDGAGRLIAVTNALNQVTRYRYDEAGNELAQIDALNRTNSYYYDAMGRRVVHTLPSGDSESYDYDAAGNVTNYTLFDGDKTISSRYDAMNRLTNRSSYWGMNDSFAYTATGQRQSMTDEAGTTTYQYDNRERLAQKVILWNDGLTGSLNYRYDVGGNLTNILSGMANGANLAYAYDPLNRLTNVLSHGQLAASYQFDLAGNLQTMRYANGVTNQYQYDALNRLTNLVWKYNGFARGSFAYQLGLTGTRTNLSEAVNGTSRTYAWSYDNLYRLTNEVVSGLGSVGYGYNGVGNRTNRTSSITALATDHYTYDTNDELSTVTSGSYAYDLNGNTTGVPGSSGSLYAYDVLNRLISSGGSLGTNFVYDGDGNRVMKSIYNSTFGQVSTYYLVDDRNPSGYAQVLEEYHTVTNLDNTPAVLSRVYNYGLALVSQQQFATNTLLAGATSYYGYDGHGSVRFLMDTNGGITDTYTYDAYGSLITPPGTTPNNYLYSGQQFDPDLGLYYNRARYLNPDTGRFWSMDSYEGTKNDPLSLHKYLYCQADPVMGIDPSGHEDIGSMMVAMDVSASLGALPGISMTQQGTLSSGGKCGPDVTSALMNTMGNVETTFFHAPYATKIMAADNAFLHPNDTMVGGWDIEKLELLGRDALSHVYDFGNGSSLGTGLGADTVQFGNPPRVYYAGSVNYILWGKLFSLFHDTFRNPLSGTRDPVWSESAAVAGARTWKAFGHHDVFNKYATEAGAFVKFGYNGTDPSSTALPLAPNPKNVGAANRLTWKWLGLRDKYE